MFRQNFQKTFIMVTPNERFNIIEKINNVELVSETIIGNNQDWWLKKHNPDSDIPRNIYLLGNGTIEELHKKYIIKYGSIEWDEFINYTRELIKQNIML
jgi:hypothetical protein